MPNKKLINYISYGIQKGYPLDSLKKQLKKKGYEKKEIDISIEFVFNKIDNASNKKSKINSKKILIFSCQVLIILALIIFFVLSIQSRKPKFLDSIYIYPDENSIVTSKLGGSDKNIIATIKNHNIGYVSPKGNYFASMNKNMPEKIYGVNGVEILDLKLSARNNKTWVPVNCKWSPDEVFFLCKYVNGKSTNMVLFKIPLGTGVKRKASIYLKAGDNKDDDFAWAEKNKLYYAMDETIRLVETPDEILKNNLENIRTLENLRRCANMEFAFGKIYCTVNGKNIGKKDGRYVIEQHPSQTGMNEFKILSKKPFSSVDYLLSVDRNLLLIGSENSAIIMNTKKGKQKPIDDIKIFANLESHRRPVYKR